MKPSPQQHVKLLLRTGTLIEGLVQEWSDQEVVLVSLDGKSQLILPRPSDDIMLIKIVLDNAETLQPTEKPKPQLPKNELEQKFEEVLNQPSNTPERTETLAELRVQLVDAEKAIISNQLKDHYIGTPRRTNYASPYDLGAAGKMRKVFRKAGKK